MVTLKNVKILNDEIARLKDFDQHEVSATEREAINRYFRIQVDDLKTSDQSGVAAKVPNIEDLINNG
jgi:hypothetical protein